MVQVFPMSTKGRLTEEAGKGIGKGIGDVLQETGEYKKNRSRLQAALSQLENLTPEQTKNPYKLLSTLISATAGIPGAERYVSPLFDQLLKQNIAQVNQQIGPPGQAGIPGLTTGAPAGVQSFRDQSPTFANQPKPQTPPPRTNPSLTPEAQAAIHPSAEPVNPTAVGPRRSTELVPPRQLMTPDQENAEADRRANDKIAKGIVTTWQEELPAVQAYNQANAAYNKTIDEENKNIIKYRDKLQAEAVKSYNQHIPKEEQNIPDQKRFENYYVEGSDKTDTERFNYARRRIDALRAARATAKTYPDRPNWYKDIRRRLEGSDRTLEQAIGEMHGILQPLLDMGEYQEARNIAINTWGLGPDETERVIHPMSSEELKQVKSIPEAKKRVQKAPAIVGGFLPNESVPEGRNVSALKNHIESLIEKNPDISLIQTRNILGKKGYDWREFSQAIQQLQNEGKLRGLSQDTLNNIGQLYNPPLKGMGAIFQNIIFGRE